ncbi:DDE superfamily endonuclease [Popillia japonica]|uniref:DDE superfamily endonuclease n=1 Tax=Popillia japonica TaxID=7064 RepID=A0AAW1IXW5_POPJA
MNERLMINSPNESVGAAQPNGWMNAELFLKWMHLLANESVGAAQPNGWMNAELFLKWMHLLVKYSNPTAENPVLLILDGHASHKDLDVIEFARKNHYTC